MRTKFFGKELDITWKHFFLIVIEILVLYGGLKLWGDYDYQNNIEGMNRMKAEIPAVVSMDGNELLSEKMKMMSRTKGLYWGTCHIDETTSEKK